MLTPQEINVWYILPAIRRELTIALKKEGLKQKDIARILGVTEPAISQYLKNKRAKNVSFTEEILKQIKEAADNMNADKSCHRYELQHLLDMIQQSGFLCKIHRKRDAVPDCCKVCLNSEKGEKECESI